MSTESGDNKIIGNFRKLIDEVSADPNYDPANNKHKIPALEAQYTAGDAAVSAVAAARTPHKLAITDRETEFSRLRPLAVRSRNYLKASGAPAGVVKEARLCALRAVSLWLTVELGHFRGYASTSSGKVPGRGVASRKRSARR